MNESVNVQAALERFRSCDGRPVILDRQRAQKICAENPEAVKSLLIAADLVLERSFCFFGYPQLTLSNPIDWHYDPIGEIEWPKIPSHRINYRVYGDDVKWVWELNRLQHLPWLAQAWLFTGDSRYERAAFEHLDSWMSENTPGQGVGWCGAFEVGVRAISIAIAVQGLRDSDELTVDRFERILKLLAESARRCWQDRSLFSSANNHLVGEMAGLAVVALLFPELDFSSEWTDSAVRILSSESDKQILADGTGAEQAVGYQIFTVELLQVVAALLLERDGRAPSAIADAIARSTSFLSAIVGESDPAPRYGDCDEGFALRLGPEAVRTVRDHLGIVSAFNWGAAGIGRGSDTLSALWYRAMMHRPPAEEAPARALHEGDRSASFFARDGGLVVVRNGGVRITMDVGPLGYLSIAAHGHADALAITLSIDGQDVIGDPGTGSYNRHPEWRAALRSTRAHGTLCIDGQDQSINAGPFIWLHHARTRVRRVDLAEGTVDAEHDGYRRLPGRPVHRRWLIAPRSGHSQLVVDLITGGGKHQVRACWPIHPLLDAKPLPFGHIVSRGDRMIAQLLYASTDPLVIDAERGNEGENLGWWSDRFESRTPAWWLGAVSNAELPIVIATLITLPAGRTTADSLTVELRSDRIVARWKEDNETRLVDIPI